MRERRMCSKEAVRLCVTLSEDYQHAEGFGWGNARPDFDWPVLLKNKNTEISRLNGLYKGMLDNAGSPISMAGLESRIPTILRLIMRSFRPTKY